jgi:hypothetical protein
MEYLTSISGVRAPRQVAYNVALSTVQKVQKNPRNNRITKVFFL